MNATSRLFTFNGSGLGIVSSLPLPNLPQSPSPQAYIRCEVLKAKQCLSPQAISLIECLSLHKSIIGLICLHEEYLFLPNAALPSEPQLYTIPK